MTEQQRQLAADNHNLIYKFMSRFHLSENAVEDWYGACAEALCRAAMGYDDTKGIEFSTFAYACMKNEMTKLLAKKDREVQTLSLDWELEDGADWYDFIADPYDRFHESEIFELFTKRFLRLKEKHRKIVADCLNPNFEDQVAVAKENNISRQWVNVIYNDFVNKFYTDLYGKDGGYIG